MDNNERILDTVGLVKTEEFPVLSVSEFISSRGEIYFFDSSETKYLLIALFFGWQHRTKGMMAATYFCSRYRSRYFWKKVGVI